MTFKLVFFLYVLSFISCKLYSGDGIEVTLENTSSSIIHDVEIGTSEELATIKYIKLEPGEKIDSFLSMKENKSDGDYQIKFTRPNGKKENIKAGYYTNGGSLETTMHINIKEDTVLVSFSGTETIF
jgi:hypothetical protein